MCNGSEDVHYGKAYVTPQKVSLTLGRWISHIGRVHYKHVVIDALHDMDPDEDVKDLRGEIVTSQKVSPPCCEDGLPTLSGCIIKVLISAKSHISSLLSETKLYK
jgi:hypothetical protein